MATLTLWETPSAYFGFSPVGHVLVLSLHRESPCMDESNWICAQARLAKAAGVEAIPHYTDPDDASACGGYWWEASHSMVGWVRYLMVKPDAPAAVLAEAQAIADALDSYPALNEDHWSELEYEQIYTYWEGLSVRDRLELVQDAGDSIFAARGKGRIPERTFDRMRDTWQ